jgi:hypothetical protein
MYHLEICARNTPYRDNKPQKQGFSIIVQFFYVFNLFFPI